MFCHALTLLFAHSSVPLPIQPHQINGSIGNGVIRSIQIPSQFQLSTFPGSPGSASIASHHIKGYSIMGNGAATLKKSATAGNIFDFTVDNVNNEPVEMNTFRGSKAYVLVNTASG